MSENAKRPLRVLVVNPDYYRSSGVTVAIRRLYEASSPSDVSYQFVSCLMAHTSAAKAEDLDWITSGEVQRLDLMSRNPISVARALLRLRRLLKSNSVDILHIHHRRLALLCGRLGRRSGVRVVYTGHLVYGGARWFKWAHFDAAIAVTPSVQEDMQLSFPERPIRVISNIVATRPYVPPPQSKTVACIARLSPVKNHKTLLKAWAQLPDRDGWALFLYGEGELRAEIASLAATLGIEESVHFAGFTNDITKAMAAAEFCVLPSLVEGQGIVTLEAASVGRPSLVSDVPGSRDCIPSAMNLPNLFPADDVDELARMLAVWMAAPDAVANDGVRLRNFSRETAAPSVVAQATLALYQSVV